MRKDYDNLIPALKELLPARSLGVVGRAVGFIRRLREIRAGAFLWAVVFSRFGHGRPGFAEASRWYRQLTGKSLAARPFQLRFKSANAVTFFARAFGQAVERWRTPRKRGSKHPLARHFSDVVVFDSTIIQLADPLQGVFPGLRGVAAGLKVMLAVSLHGLVPLFTTIAAATRNDMTLFPPLKGFPRGALLLFDRGFVSYQRLRDIADAGHFYVCRLRSNGNALVVGARRAPPHVLRALRRNPGGVLLRELLPRGKRIAKQWDLDVTLRTDVRRSRRVPSRLVLVPGPKREQRCYLTNLPSRPWTCGAVAETYRLRWQIELVFKELKQNLNLATLPSRDPHAVQVFAWASLIALALARGVTSCFSPVQALLGLRAPLRVMLMTRALRACIRLLGYALVATARELPTLMRAFVQDLRREASTLRPQREDSVDRLQRLISAQGVA